MVAGAATLEAGSPRVGIYLQGVSDFGGCGAGGMGAPVVSLICVQGWIQHEDPLVEDIPFRCLIGTPNM